MYKVMKIKKVILSSRGGRMSDVVIFCAGLKAVQKLLNKRCTDVEDWLCRCVACSLLRGYYRFFLLVFAFFLSFNISLSYADEVINCQTGQQSCGTNCCWSIEGDTLKVTGGVDGSIGHMDDGAEVINGYYTYIMPWKDLGSKFTKVDIQGVDNVGQAAFRTFSNITDIKLGDTIKTIAPYAFGGLQFVEDLTIPDSVTSVGYRAFSDNGLENALKTIILPDSVTNIGESAFGTNEEQLKNIEIICKGNQQNCSNALTNYEYYIGASYYPTLDLSSNVSPASSGDCASTNFYWNGLECVRQPDKAKRTCCANCKNIGNNTCSRIRYTPAEVARIVGESNTILLYYK